VSDLPIAATPEALTPDWLTAALRSSGHLEPDGRVVGVDIGPVGTGQMGAAVRLGLRYEGAGDAPATLIAKLAADDEASRATARMVRAYEREVRFYQQLAPRLPVRTPCAFYADIDVETCDVVLLLEDLSPAQPGDQLAGCSVAAARTAVDELVKLHAPRWGDPTLADLEWLHRDPVANQRFLQGLLPELWGGFRHRYAGELGPDVHEAGGALLGRLDGYLLADTTPWTIVHGDYRLDNLLFTATPDDRTTVAVVDWQTCAHGPGLTDVAYFIGAGLSAEDRRAAERDLVAGYHAGLLGAGVEGYDWDRCWHDYRRGTWSGLIMAVAASMLVERTPRGDIMFLAMAARHARHALDLDAASIIGA
jgi:Phosphotransferase enzyme family